MSSRSSSRSSSSSDDPELPRRRRIRIQKAQKEEIADYVLDADSYTILYSVSRDEFEKLTDRLEEQILKTGTRFKDVKPLAVTERISIFLRYLSSGKTFVNIAKEYGVTEEVINVIVSEMSDMFVADLEEETMPPLKKESWPGIIEGFRTKLDMPNCVGSVGGKFLVVKDHPAIIFLALVDADQKFLMVDFTKQEAVSHRVWVKSNIAKQIIRNTWEMPLFDKPAGYSKPLPYVVVGGNTFPTRQHILTKYKTGEVHDAKKIFNYRLEPAKSAVDEAMARLRRRWSFLRTTFEIPPEMVKRVIKAACCLDNFLSPPAI